MSRAVTTCVTLTEIFGEPNYLGSSDLAKLFRVPRAICHYAEKFDGVEPDELNESANLYKSYLEPNHKTNFLINPGFPTIQKQLIVFCHNK